MRPEDWFEGGADCLDAAKLAWNRLHAERSAGLPPELISRFLWFAGLTIENYLKGLLVAQILERDEEGYPPLIHDLVELVRQTRVVSELTASQQSLLARLTAHSVWSAREEGPDEPDCHVFPGDLGDLQAIVDLARLRAGLAAARAAIRKANPAIIVVTSFPG